MAVDPNSRLSPQDYLAIERDAEWKSEYLNGERVAMTGGSFEHGLLLGNTARLLGQELLARPCVVVPSDLRVKVSATGLYTYPDIVVVCGERQFDDENRDTLLNPILLVEVLSPSTEAYDRGKKFEHYRTIESLREYVLVAQREPRVDHYLRQEDGSWLFRSATGLDAVLPLPSLDCELPLADVYAKTGLSQ
jgi:Uma2 family endonuclease